MKKRSAIFFFFIFLGTTTEFGQLLKFPKFIAHYIKHREEAPGLGLLSFIQLHYNDQDIKDADYEQDMQLPFKTQDAFTAGINLSPVIIPASDFATAGITYTPHISHPLIDEDLLPNFYNGSIFQPPRIIYC